MVKFFSFFKKLKKETAPVPKKNEKDKREHIVSRFTVIEMVWLKKTAKEDCTSINSVIRRCVNKEIEAEKK